MLGPREEPDEAPTVGSSCVSEDEAVVSVVDRVQYVVCAMVGRSGIHVAVKSVCTGVESWAVPRSRPQSQSRNYIVGVGPLFRSLWPSISAQGQLRPV